MRINPQELDVVMAHGILSENDFISKSVGNRVNAWHGVGRYLQSPTMGDISPMFDWEVIAESPIGVTSDDIDLLIRSDNRRLLGTASKKYKPFQNAAILEQFVEPFLLEGGYAIETSGVLWGGTTNFVALKVDHELLLDSNNPLDIAKPILTLAWGHDGKTPVRCFFGAVRVVCSNTLAMGLAGASESHTFRHFGDIAKKAHNLRKCIEESTHYYDRLAEDYQLLASTPYSSRGEIVNNLLKLTLGDPHDMSLSGNLRSRATGRWRTLFDVFSGNRADKSTLGGWYSAVDETLDHSGSEKTTATAAATENRFESLVLGGSKAKIKSGLFADFLAMV